MKTIPFRVSCILFWAVAALAQGTPAGRPADGARFNVLLDRHIDPCEDFYAYACNQWQAQNPIPPDQSSWGRFDEATARNETLLRGILEKYSSANTSRDALEQKMGDYYQSCMDENAVEKAGTGPLQPELRTISVMTSKDDLAPLLGQLHRHGVAALFHISPEQDFKDASRVIGQIEPGGTAFPDHDLYLRTDRQAAVFRKQYLKHLQKMFELLGDSKKEAEAEATGALAIETSLAEATLDPQSRSEHTTTYRMTTLPELNGLAPDFNWKAYFAAIGWPGAQPLQVSKPPFFQRMSEELRLATLPDLKAYLRWQIMHAQAEVLPSSFTSEDFNFFEKTVSGTRELPARWKRCVRLTSSALGQALGQKYEEAEVTSEDVARVSHMVAGIEKALGNDIDGVLWMGLETRRQARQKLAAIRSRIGHPGRWRDYASLEIARGDLLGNWLRAREFEFRHQLEKIGEPVDPDDWPYPEFTVDASYSDQQNSITLPAGILQSPFYDRHGDEAFNLGAIGGLIGHELTHGFDDEGSQFDAEGDLRDWWSATDRNEFRRRTQCVARQYSDYTAVDKIRVDGNLTLAENVADNGGLRLAYAALREILAGKTSGAENPMPDGTTANQRFFLGWANLWCQNRTAALSRDLAANASHSPGKWRVNGVVSNMPEFQQAFHCRPDAPMVRQDRCRVW